MQSIHSMEFKECMASFRNMHGMPFMACRYAFTTCVLCKRSIRWIACTRDGHAMFTKKYNEIQV